MYKNDSKQISFKKVLSKVYAKTFRKNNEKVCIDCLKPRSNKTNLECKNCSCTDFYLFDYQNYLFKILPSL